MLATWLRAPDWIAGRNSWRGWWKPTLAIIAPLLLIAVMLPSSRLAQMRYRPLTSLDQTNDQAALQQDFVQRLVALRDGDNTEASKTADMYLRVATNLYEHDGPALREPRRKPEHLNGPGSTGQAYATAISEAMEISKRPDCRFHFDPNYIAPPPTGTTGRQPINLVKDRTRDNMNQLIQAVAGVTTLSFDQPAPRFLAALRMGKHVRSGQPSAVVARQLRDEKSILQWIADWALSRDRTKEELREVLDALTPELQAPESPADSLLADHAIILDVISGKQTPLILTTNPIEPHAYLAFLANQLGWERQRAEKALDRITRTNIRDVDRLTSIIDRTTPQEVGVGIVRHWLRPDFGGLPELWEIVDPAAITSYLTSLEYKARVPISDLNRAYCDNVTCRHATLLQIALALYRLEHKKYPARLAELVPEYLEQLPLDPYSSPILSILTIRPRPAAAILDRRQQLRRENRSEYASALERGRRQRPLDAVRGLVESG